MYMNVSLISGTGFRFNLGFLTNAGVILKECNTCIFETVSAKTLL
jgi:hypothetical protein